MYTVFHETEMKICAGQTLGQHITVLPLVGGQGGLQPTRNLGAQLTLLQPGGADYAHHITASPPGFENPAASLHVGVRVNASSVKY